MQWRNEIAAHTDDMKVLVWHGSGRESDTKQLIKYDVVLTTYAVLESCFRKQHSGFKRKGQIIKENSPLHAIEWNRVIVSDVGVPYSSSIADICSTSWMRHTTSKSAQPTRPRLRSS